MKYKNLYLIGKTLGETAPSKTIEAHWASNGEVKYVDIGNISSLSTLKMKWIITMFSSINLGLSKSNILSSEVEKRF